MCQSTPVRALVVPVCCKRGLNLRILSLTCKILSLTLPPLRYEYGASHHRYRAQGRSKHPHAQGALLAARSSSHRQHSALLLHRWTRHGSRKTLISAAGLVRCECDQQRAPRLAPNRRQGTRRGWQCLPAERQRVLRLVAVATASGERCSQSGGGAATFIGARAGAGDGPCAGCDDGHGRQGH